MNSIIPIGTHIWPCYSDKPLKTAAGDVPRFCSKRIDAVKEMRFDDSQVESIPAVSAFSRFTDMNAKGKMFVFVRFDTPKTPPGSTREAIGVVVDRLRCVPDSNSPMDDPFAIPATPAWLISPARFDDVGAAKELVMTAEKYVYGGNSPRTMPAHIINAMATFISAMEREYKLLNP